MQKLNKPNWSLKLIDAVRRPGVVVNVTEGSRLLCEQEGTILPGQCKLFWVRVESRNGLQRAEGTVGMVSPDVTRLEANSLASRGPTRLLQGGRTRVELANWSDEAVVIPKGMHVAQFREEELDDFAILSVSRSDPAFRPRLQEALEASEEARRLAEDQLTPMYFDQLNQRQEEELVADGLPKEIVWDGTMCDAEQLLRLKSLLRRHLKGFARNNAKPN